MISTYLEYRTTSNVMEIRHRPFYENAFEKLREIFSDSELYISKEFGFIGSNDIEPANAVFSDLSKIKKNIETHQTTVRTLIFDGSRYDACETAAISKLIDDADFKQLTSFGWKNVKHQVATLWTKPKETIRFATFADADGMPFPMDLNTTLPNLYELNLYLRDRETLQSVLRVFRNMLNFGMFATAQMFAFAAGAITVFFWLNPQVASIRINFAFHRDFLGNQISIPEFPNLKELTLKEYNDSYIYPYDQYIRFDQVKRFEIEINYEHAITPAMRLPYIFGNIEELIVTFHTDYSKKYNTNIPPGWLAPLLNSTAIERVTLMDTGLDLSVIDQLLSVSSIRQISGAYPHSDQIAAIASRLNQSKTVDHVVFFNVDMINGIDDHLPTAIWRTTATNDFFQIDRIKQ